MSTNRDRFQVGPSHSTLPTLPFSVRSGVIVFRLIRCAINLFRFTLGAPAKSLHAQLSSTFGRDAAAASSPNAERMAPGAHPRTQRLIEVRARKCMCMSVDRVDGFSDDEDSRTQKEDAHRCSAACAAFPVPVPLRRRYKRARNMCARCVCMYKYNVL